MIEFFKNLFKKLFKKFTKKELTELTPLERVIWLALR
jgi:hypothetical protein